MNNTPLTVRDLREILAKLPDNTELWAFNDGTFTFSPITNAVHDKRVNGLNFWFTSE